MKTYGHLFHRIADFQNLWNAAHFAARGKRKQPNVASFLTNLEEELTQLQRELETQCYTPGAYTTFKIWEPKERLISAAPFRDRVVHHALCNVIDPLFERRFIFDTWANRDGKGTHRAMNRFQAFARRHRYVLMCDIRKYFPSIDHEILKAKVRRVIRCKRTLWLVDAIIDGSNEQEPVRDYFPGDDLFTPGERRKGLPIGNLTSQFFANVYLDEFDHFVKETLRQKRYLRYVDDFAVFGDDKAALWELREVMAERLEQDRLRLHERKSRVWRTSDGVAFLGFRIWPRRRKIKRENVRRMQSRLRWFRKQFAAGRMEITEIGQRIRCWLAHAQHGDTQGLVKRLLYASPFVRDEAAQ